MSRFQRSRTKHPRSLFPRSLLPRSLLPSLLPRSHGAEAGSTGCSAAELRSNGGVEKAERDRIMRQQVVLPQTPRQRRELEALEEDLKSISLAGKPLALRLRNFRSSAETYLASAGGPLPYMVRLREIERQIAAHEAALAEEWRGLAVECTHDMSAPPGRFARRWRATARSWIFDEVNDLIDRHNRWYPAESRLPMDPRTGDYALVNGRDYRLAPLDADWVLERFPPRLARALAAA
jgi:hypothetical protein